MKEKRRRRVEPELIEKAEPELRMPPKELKKRTNHRFENGVAQVPPKERTVLRSGAKSVESRVERILEGVKQRNELTRRRVERLPDDLAKARVLDLLVEWEHKDWKYAKRKTRGRGNI